jgi:hypothetical protein
MSLSSILKPFFAMAVNLRYTELPLHRFSTAPL